MSEGYSVDHQKLLLQAIISEPELFARSQNILQSEYFARQLQKSVKFILEFAFKYKSMPTPEQIFAESGVRLELLDQVKIEHKKYFLDEIEKFCQHAALTQAILTGADMIEKENYGGIEKLIKDALSISLTKNLGINYFENPKERLLKLKEDNGKISTGWETLDQKLYNVNRGELMIFCAPSGGGKSVALQNLSINMALQTLNCVYITLELSEKLCAKRIDSMISGIKTTEIYKKLDEVELAVVSTGKRSGLITIKKMPSMVSTRDISSYLREYQIQKKHSPDVVIIDYLDLMSPNDKRISPSDMFNKDRFISEELRNMGEEFYCLVATASQLNRCLDINTNVFKQNVGNVSIKNIEIGDKIQSKNGFNIVLAKTAPNKQKVYKITTSLGKSIICSDKHVFPTDNGEMSLENGLSIGSKLYLKRE